MSCAKPQVRDLCVNKKLVTQEIAKVLGMLGTRGKDRVALSVCHKKPEKAGLKYLTAGFLKSGQFLEDLRVF